MSWPQSFSQLLKFSCGLSILCSVAYAKTDLNSLFEYAGKTPRLQEVQRSFGTCAQWLLATPPILQGMTKATAEQRYAKVWKAIVGEKQKLDEQGHLTTVRDRDAALIFKEDGQLKVFNPLGLDVHDALQGLGIAEADVQTFTSLADLAASRNFPETDDVGQITDYLSTFPETQRVFTAVFRKAGNDKSNTIKAFDSSGNALTGVNVRYNTFGTGVLYEVLDPNSNLRGPAVANVVAFAGVGADSSNAISVLPFGQALNVSKNGHFKNVRKIFKAEGKEMPRVNFFATDNPFSGNGLQLGEEEQDLEAAIMRIGKTLLEVRSRTSSDILQTVVARSAAAGPMIEFLRRQQSVIDELRAQATDKVAFDRILPPGTKLVDMVVFVGPTNVVPEKGYDASLQQSIEDALNTESTGYRPNWPSFCWCHDIYMSIKDKKEQVSVSWEDYFQQALKDTPVYIFVGEHDQQTLPSARNFYQQLGDKLENVHYDVVDKAGHDVFSNTASNRNEYSPVSMLYTLLSRILELVDVDDVEVSGQIRLAARVGQGSI